MPLWHFFTPVYIHVYTVNFNDVLWEIDHQVNNHGGKNVTPLGVVMHDDIKIILP